MLFTVAAAESLVDRLAGWALAEAEATQEALADSIIFLPSRRTVRSLKEAFLRQSQGRAMLLPHMVAVSDIDESFLLRHATPDAATLTALQALLPEPPPMQRLLTLQELVWHYGKTLMPRLHDREAALDLAVNLVALMDEMDRDGGDWNALPNLVPEELAQYWQQTVQFLDILRQHWPQIEAEKGWMRPWQRRNEIIRLLIECWQTQPPQRRVIAAGTTGSVPAVRRLLRAVADLPQGMLVLPGYDVAAMQAVPEGEELPDTHPHATMQTLLHSIGAKPEQVQPLPGGSAEGCNRQALLSLAMVPETQLERWWQPQGEQITAQAEGLHWLELPQPQDTAQAAALLMREGLEQADNTTALITPDRQLARAVSAHLARWGIQVDDSAGQPLAQMPQSIFLFLILNAVQQEGMPVALLSLLKHPLCTMGRSRAAILQAARELETTLWRGLVNPVPQKWWPQVKEVSQETAAVIEQLWAQLEPLRENYLAQTDSAFSALCETLLTVAETLSESGAGECQLWLGDGAGELSRFLAPLRELEAEQPISFEEFPGMLRALMRSEVVRPAYGTHPRLQILSPMEARLQRFNRVILADLNEGGWPELASADPWMNRPMRGELGLPSPDKRLGQQAHDFVQQAAGGEVFLLRSLRYQAAEALPSRLWQRLATVLQMQSNRAHPRINTHPVHGWVKALQHPPEQPVATRPAPVPPVEARPRELSVTRIERLMQDPYSIYAQKILRLKKLEALEPEPGFREFGMVMHQAIQDHYEQNRPIMACVDRILAQQNLGYLASEVWYPRMRPIAEWVESQPRPLTIRSEQFGAWVFAAPGGNFTLTARVDRLEESALGFSIIDYKTGDPPAKEWVKQGMSNQLTLAAVIAKQGGFGTHLQGKPVEALEYWKLGGAEGGKRESVLGKTSDEWNEEVLVQQATEGLPQIIARFDEPDTPYESLPEYRFRPKYNDYEHLARVKEWLD